MVVMCVQLMFQVIMQGKYMTIYIMVIIADFVEVDWRIWNFLWRRMAKAETSSSFSTWRFGMERICSRRRNNLLEWWQLKTARVILLQHIIVRWRSQWPSAEPLTIQWTGNDICTYLCTEADKLADNESNINSPLIVLLLTSALLHLLFAPSLPPTHSVNPLLLIICNDSATWQLPKNAFGARTFCSSTLKAGRRWEHFCWERQIDGTSISRRLHRRAFL